MTTQFVDMTSPSIFFWPCFVSLVTFSYWSKLHVNIITGSRVMTIYFYKGLTRNPEIGNTLVWVSPNILRFGWANYAKHSTDVSNKMLLNAAKYKGYSFYCSWVIKGKPTGGKITTSPTQINMEMPECRLFTLYNAQQEQVTAKVAKLSSKNSIASIF